MQGLQSTETCQTFTSSANLYASTNIFRGKTLPILFAYAKIADQLLLYKKTILVMFSLEMFVEAYKFAEEHQTRNLLQGTHCMV